ncbi:MAG: tRNA (adenosine(37)-N6)-threonylcarbamoyltransferase complex transferase subunit TsaD [Planctomycetota bacterium]
MSVTILGIETSCDETSAAVVVDGRDVRANVVSSQVKLHEKYGGIVPEIASRAHIEQIEPIIREALAQAGAARGAMAPEQPGVSAQPPAPAQPAVPAQPGAPAQPAVPAQPGVPAQPAALDFADLDAIAVASGPGLVGSLLIGVTAAKTLALTCGLPLVEVDHIEAHATSAALVADPLPWPAVALVVSGGHTSLYLVDDFHEIELLGQTVDDAAGEAFDKVAAILELGYPGGPLIDRLAQTGDPKAVRFPRTWINEPHLNFSFSGLKTAVLYHVYGAGRKYGSAEHLGERGVADVAASFQAALVETLVTKTVAAARQAGVRNVVVGGGVAANSALRAGLTAACAAAGLALHLTPLQYCTDNAAMIAALGYRHFIRGERADLWFEPHAGLRRPPLR